MKPSITYSTIIIMCRHKIQLIVKLLLCFSSKFMRKDPTKL